MQIKGIAKRPDSDYYTSWFSNNLESLQRFVGGYIEAVPMPMIPDVVILCDEDGRLKGEQYCCRIFDVDFVGTILIVRVNEEGEFDSLDDDFVKHWLRTMKKR